VLVVGVFGAIWMLGFARALQLRPILVTDDLLSIRSGLLWRLDVPRSMIGRIEIGPLKFPDKQTPGYLRAALGPPNVLITLRGPARAYGAYGTGREVLQVGLVLDDAKEFERAITRP
jgi:hypothetical protein